MAGEPSSSSTPQSSNAQWPQLATNASWYSTTGAYPYGVYNNSSWDGYTGYAQYAGYPWGYPVPPPPPEEKSESIPEKNEVSKGSESFKKEENASVPPLPPGPPPPVPAPPSVKDKNVANSEKQGTIQDSKSKSDNQNTSVSNSDAVSTQPFYAGYNNQVYGMYGYNYYSQWYNNSITPQPNSDFSKPPPQFQQVNPQAAQQASSNSAAQPPIAINVKQQLNSPPTQQQSSPVMSYPSTPYNSDQTIQSNTGPVKFSISGEKNVYHPSKASFNKDFKSSWPQTNFQASSTAYQTVSNNQSKLENLSNSTNCASNNDTSSATSGDWPESLKRYVGKCFAKCITELDKDQVEIILKGKLTLAANNGTLWTKDWDQEPLPSVNSEKMLKNIKDQFPVLEKQSPQKAGKRLLEGGYNPNQQKQAKQFGVGEGENYAFGRNANRGGNRGNRGQKRFFNSKENSISKESGYIGLDTTGKSGNNESAGSFIKSNNSEGNRGSFKRGRGRGRGNSVNSINKNNEDGSKEEEAYFWSKDGKMFVDSDIGSTEKLQKRAARFCGMDSKTSNVNNRGSARGFARGHRGAKRGAKRGAIAERSMPLSFNFESSFTVDNDTDWTALHIVGTSTVMEKQYLRLTTAPDPSTVRTVDTLKKSLEHVKQQWVQQQDYHYACDQLKSIRQDLTVQGIRDDFTVYVYETHSRIALEKGDNEEFNQCQSQLRQLYQDIDMTSALAELTPSDKLDECVTFVLKLREAWSLKNYHTFFKLYRAAPKMSAYLMDWFIGRERTSALKVMVKGYRPGSVDVDFVQKELAFTSVEDWNSFVEPLGIIYVDNLNTKIDCKLSLNTAA